MSTTKSSITAPTSPSPSASALASSSTSAVTVRPIVPTTTANKTFTLNDLAKIALGAPTLTKEHLSVLQSLLLILLRKLDCHNETVKINGMPGTCLRKLSEETTTTGQYDFQLRNLKGFKEKYELLDKLEQRLSDLQMKLEKHFNQIRHCHKTNIFQVEMWDYYAAATEDLCSLYMQQNKELCLLVRNIIFNRELRKRITNPLVEHMKEFEAKIQKMRAKKSDEGSPSDDCLQAIISKIERFRPGLKQHNDIFREAMDETQNMLNCKLERVTLPALKKYLDDRFNVIKEHLNILKIEANKCAPSKPLVLQKGKCLSCTRHGDYHRLKGLQSIQSVKETPTCTCSANYVGEYTILEKLDRMSPPVHRSYLLITSPIVVRPSNHSSILRYEMRGILVNNEKIVSEDPALIDVTSHQSRPSVRKSLRWYPRGSKKSLVSSTLSTSSLRKIKSVHLHPYSYGA